MSRKIIKSKTYLYDEKIETIAEVPEKDLELLPLNKDLKIIGKKIPRVDAEEKVTGTAVYTFDKIFTNIAYGKTLRSPYPFAKIESIETSKAEKLKGVLKILTYKNAPDIKWYGDYSKLFDQTVRYEGDEVALIVAETQDIAEKDASLVDVKYKELDFVTDTIEAIKDDAPKIYKRSNIPEIRGHAHYSRGNFEDGIKSADIVLEREYSTQVAIQNPTEPHGSVVKWEDDQLIVWDSTQGVFSIRDTIAGSFNIPESKVRVIKEYMGGGFGAKLEAGKYSVMAAIASKEIKRPVKVILEIGRASCRERV